MPRSARVAPNEYIYHVLTRGINRMDVLRDDEDFARYLHILKTQKEKHSFHLYHYVLMSNHVHLVIEPDRAGGDLPRIMKAVNLSYTLYYKNKYDHIGHFWQDRYKSILISKDDYLLACGSYVELNPVRAGICDHPRGYRWSSYPSHAYGRLDGITDANPLFEGISDDSQEKRKRYREFVEGMLKKRDAQRGEMAGRRVYGNEEFVGAIMEGYGVSEMVKKRGRPRKEIDK